MRGDDHAIVALDNRAVSGQSATRRIRARNDPPKDAAYREGIDGCNNDSQLDCSGTIADMACISSHPSRSGSQVARCRRSRSR